MFNGQDAVDAGYEIREAPVIFELPYFDYPSLPSGDDFYATCGSITYTVNLVGKDISSWPDIAVQTVI